MKIYDLIGTWCFHCFARIVATDVCSDGVWSFFRGFSVGFERRGWWEIRRAIKQEQIRWKLGTISVGIQYAWIQAEKSVQNEWETTVTGFPHPERGSNNLVILSCCNKLDLTTWQNSCCHPGNAYLAKMLNKCEHYLQHYSAIILPCIHKCARHRTEFNIHE